MEILFYTLISLWLLYSIYIFFDVKNKLSLKVINSLIEFVKLDKYKTELFDSPQYKIFEIERVRVGLTHFKYNQKFLKHSDLDFLKHIPEEYLEDMFIKNLTKEIYNNIKKNSNIIQKVEDNYDYFSLPTITYTCDIFFPNNEIPQKVYFGSVS